MILDMVIQGQTYSREYEGVQGYKDAMTHGKSASAVLLDEFAEVDTGYDK